MEMKEAMCIIEGLGFGVSMELGNMLVSRIGEVGQTTNLPTAL